VTKTLELTGSALLVRECLARPTSVEGSTGPPRQPGCPSPNWRPDSAPAVHTFTRETLLAAIESLEVAATHGTSPGSPRRFGYDPRKDPCRVR
jgi:hypothetical protein